MIACDRDQWQWVQNQMVTKAIEELVFEEVLQVVPQENGEFKLVFEDHNYLFFADRSIWGHLHIDPHSLKKLSKTSGLCDVNALQFFRESQKFTGMDDLTLATFLEEANQTLFSDMQQHLLWQNLNLSEVAKWNYYQLDRVLPGHPKIILNKGRLGWGENDLKHFAPEFLSEFQLHWVAIDHSFLKISSHQLWSQRELLKQSLSEHELQWIDGQISQKGDATRHYVVLPVHPWQWQRYIRIQFQNLLHQEQMIYLGKMGDKYSSQVSIRTLFNSQRTNSLDIKLPLSILNTSCVRGIPERYIEKSAEVSVAMQKIVDEDSLLNRGSVKVAQEVAAIHCRQPDFHSVVDSPYRYKEMLGCVWRQNLQSLVEDHQKVVPTAALFFSSQSGSLISEYMRQSGLSPKKWIRQYFSKVVVPLYHLQLRHGIGLVAHGQNTAVVLEKGCPVGLVIKDFHGDLRLSTQSQHLDHPAFVNLEKLPPHYLIHDLFTGHFVTVLRYVSKVCVQEKAVSEKIFYAVLAEEIEAYLAHQPKPDHDALNLLRKNFEKVLVNKVRFVAGYSEGQTRLKPLLGEEILNPLFVSKNQDTVLQVLQ